MIDVGLVGYGYWGPNLARNFSQQPGARLAIICDSEGKRLEAAQRAYPSIPITPRSDEVFDNPDIRLVLIATPVHTHFDLASRALRAGKDVLLSKPMTRTAKEAEALLELADRNRCLLAVDHTYLYTGSVRKIKEVVSQGELGDLLYFDSIRINLGLFQHDVNVIYDLAPHDLSILNHLCASKPKTVQAMGASHAQPGIEDLGYLHLEYDDGFVAHIHLNWLSPVKFRRILIGGTKKMILFDELDQGEKVKVYDKGIVVRHEDVDSVYKILVDYRTGDMVAPKVEHREALQVEAEHIVRCVQTRAEPLTAGATGLAVIRVLEAAEHSIKNGGVRVTL